MRTKISAAAAAILALAVMPAAKAPVPASGGQWGLASNREVKHVIIMVADGMGLADVTAARIRKNGIGGPPLRFEALEEIGFQRSCSEKNTVTDSAAAAAVHDGGGASHRHRYRYLEPGSRQRRARQGDRQHGRL